jgi:branched-chain amino acid transport system permease protein
MLFELTPFIGLPYTITGLVVIILGGLGSVAGSLLGGLILGVVEALGVHFTSPDLRTVISYAVLALVLILRPYGLFNPMAHRPGQAVRA